MRLPKQWRHRSHQAVCAVLQCAMSCSLSPGHSKFHHANPGTLNVLTTLKLLGACGLVRSHTSVSPSAAPLASRLDALLLKSRPRTWCVMHPHCVRLCGDSHGEAVGSCTLGSAQNTPGNRHDSTHAAYRHPRSGVASCCAAPRGMSCMC